MCIFAIVNHAPLQMDLKIGAGHLELATRCSKWLLYIGLIIALLVQGKCAQYEVNGGYLAFLLLPAIAVGSSATVDPAAVVSIRSFQSGVTAMTSTTVNVAITPVEMARSAVFCDATARHSTHEYLVTCELSASGQITLRTEALAAQRVSWKVVYFGGDASVQRGSGSFGAAVSDQNIVIASVDLSSSVVLAMTRTSDMARDRDEQRMIRGQLITPNQLRLSRQETGITINYVWQVVTLDAATVSTGNLTLTSANSVVNGINADASNSLLVFTGSPDGSVDGVERQYGVRARIPATGMLEFNREIALNTVDLSWFALNLPGTRSFSGTVAPAAAGNTIINVAIPAVDPARTLSVISVSIPSGPGENNHFDAAAMTSRLIGDTTLRLERQGPDGQSVNIDWQIVEFPIE